MQPLRIGLVLLLGAIGTGSATANLITNGDFDALTTAQVPACGVGNNPWPASYCANANPAQPLWGRPDFRWSGGWGTSTISSWTYLPTTSTPGVWGGGFANRTEDFGAGWKWARSGNLYGGVKDRQTLSQTFMFTGTVISQGSLEWYDAGRPSWDSLTWFGSPNDYSVTITDDLMQTQLIGDYTSAASNLDGSVWSDASKRDWVRRMGENVFTLEPGRIYTLSFNSLAPLQSDGSPQDRTTFLDDIVLTASPLGSPVPEPGALLLLGIGALSAGLARRRVAGR